MRVRVFLLLSSFLYALHWKTHSVIHTCFFLDNTTSCQPKVIQGHRKVTSRTSQGHLILNYRLLFTHNQMCFSNVIIKCFVGKIMIISPIWQICSKTKHLQSTESARSHYGILIQFIWSIISGTTLMIYSSNTYSIIAIYCIIVYNPTCLCLL